MELSEIIKEFKTKLNPLKIMNKLEKAAAFNEELNNDLEGNHRGADLKNNPYSNSPSDFIKSFSAVKISQKIEVPPIKLTDVWKIYQMGEVEFAALKGINLKIYEGEFLVVLGPSGSGKSTLMNLLGCLDLPSKGTVCLSSKDISKLNESELAKIRGQMIGFIFQSFNLIPTLNTYENVLLPLEFQEEDAQKARKKAAYLLEIVGTFGKETKLAFSTLRGTESCNSPFPCSESTYYSS
jgi:ABC-type antimicrobial peptide transport system, ATPase component